MQIIRVEYYNRQLAKDVIETFFNQSKVEINDSFFLNKNNYLYVAIVDQKVVGQVYGYTFDRLDTQKQQVFIYAIDVLEAYQNQGIGKKLIEAFLNPFKMGKHRNAFVITHELNEKAIRLYRSAGGKLVNSIEGHSVLFDWTLN